MGLFDLEKHFAFYGAYHSDPVNIVIHTLLVWPIFFTALLLFSFTPPLFHLPLPLPLAFNFGFVFAAVYALFYVSLDRRAGSLAALLCALCWVGSGLLGSRLGFSLGWKVVLAAQLLCWIGQFIGHGVFEVLQFLFGYEPYPGFHAGVLTKIEADRKEWQGSKEKKSS